MIVSSTVTDLAEEVDVPGPERDQLAPAHAGLDRGLDHQPVPVGDRGDEERRTPSGVRVRDLRGDDLGQLGVRARVGHDQPVADRSGEDRVQHGVVLADRPRRQPAGGGLGHPVLDQGGGDLVQLLPAEERVEVLVQVGHVRGLGGGLDVLAGQPVGLDVLAEPHLAEGVRRARSRPGPSAPRGCRPARRRGGRRRCRRSGAGPRGRGSRRRTA